MRIEHEPNMPALRRDWLGARILGTIGLTAVFATAVLLVFAWWSAGPGEPPASADAPAPTATADPNLTIVVPPPTSPADARKQEGIALCDAALGTAQRAEIIPTFATRASDETQSTNVQGRYICLAKTDAAHYSIDFDLTCTNLSQGNCIALYNVSQAGGGVLYQRK